MPPTLYLLDGHALAYRTYYALTRGGTGAERWITREGEPTAGTYGFVSVLLRILEQERPDYLIVVFDAGKTFRDEIFPDYKGTREKMPDDLVPQLERIHQLLEVFNIPSLEVEGFEADDVLGSLAKKAASQGLGVKIITGDRDLLQLVDKLIVVTLPGRSLSDSKDYFLEDVKEQLGVNPEQVVDYKALVGDKSDNIPGVPGIGEKTATSLLEKYDTLENIYANLEELPPGVRKKMEAGRQSALMSQKLAQIVTDLNIDLDLDNARTNRIDPKQVEPLFRDLEFRSLFNRLKDLSDSLNSSLNRQMAGDQLVLFETKRESQVVSPVPVNHEDIQVKIVNTHQGLQDLVSRLNNSKLVAVDTETTSTDQMKARLVGISLAVEDNEAYYIPVGHIGGKGDQLPLETVIDGLRAILVDERLKKIGHNIKYDFVVLNRYGLKISPLSFDTMIAEWLVNPASRNLGLKNLVWVRLGQQMTEIDELIGKGKKQINMAEVEIEAAASYAADDAAVLLKLMPLLTEELRNSGAETLFLEIEMPLISVLADMEMTGIVVDTDFLTRMSGELKERLVTIEDKIYTSVGSPFNLNSPQQLSKALFDQLGLAPPDRRQRTASGFYSTAVDVLESLKGSHPVVDWILEYRELSKLKSTYVDALPSQVNPETKRIHTSYNQTGSVTGRIASSEPNLQNIPIRTELGRQVRRAFIPKEDHLLLSVDYSQVELRIVAHMAEDEAMIASFQADQDIHAATAAAIFGIPLAAVDSTQRSHAKAINFGLIYGMSPFGLTRYTNLTLAEAEDFVKAYFEKFPGVKRYLDGMRRKAAEDGFVETLLGRRRYFPGLKNQTNHNIRQREEREAINAPIQGTAADIMKIAMLRVPPALHEAGLSAKMLLQVHDELVLECPLEEMQETAALVSQVMQDAYELKVPLKTEARTGRNWYEMSIVSI
ncbi:MAG: DNA polymerase I [Anaerolineales bacterium]|nr:DNA polymerase I [Anaerolineales bacterium]